MRRRLGSIVVAALVLSMLGALPVMALDLEDYLRRSAEADFSGRQVVACATPDGVRDAVLEVEQADGTLLVRQPVSDGSAMMVSPGGSTVSVRQGTSSATVLSGGHQGAVHDYAVAAETAVSYDGRAATQITVRRDGVDRARMTFDDATGALLRTETLNADGSRYCEISIASFDADPGAVLSAQIPTAAETSTLTEIEDTGGLTDLPSEVAGFNRIDVYELRPGQVVAYYSDGLFSFTLLRSERPLDAADLEIHTTERGIYRRAFGPNQAVYVWEVGDRGYALLGDQPLDLQDDVLSHLPVPTRPGFWSRFWRRLFG